MAFQSIPVDQSHEVRPREIGEGDPENTTACSREELLFIEGNKGKLFGGRYSYPGFARGFVSTRPWKVFPGAGSVFQQNFFWWWWWWQEEVLVLGWISVWLSCQMSATCLGGLLRFLRFQTFCDLKQIRCNPPSSQRNLLRTENCSNPTIRAPPPQNPEWTWPVQSWGWYTFCCSLRFWQFVHHPLWNPFLLSEVFCGGSIWWVVP